MRLVKATWKELRLCQILKSEIKPSRLANHDFTNTVMVKPWGIEYMNYEAEDKSCCSWFLHILPDQRTSMHCHATKWTFIHVIDGSIILRLLGRRPIHMKAGDSVILDKRVFHAMVANEEGVRLLEIESPSYKPDAIRYMDIMDRVGEPYESKCLVIK